MTIQMIPNSRLGQEAAALKAETGLKEGKPEKAGRRPSRRVDEVGSLPCPFLLTRILEVPLCLSHFFGSIHFKQIKQIFNYNLCGSTQRKP